MIDVIFDSMMVAGRVGAQIGAQIEIDQTIDAWYRYSEDLKLARDQAKQQAEINLRLAQAFQCELENCKVQLENREKEISSTSKNLKLLVKELNTAKEKISFLDRSLIRYKFHMNNAYDIVIKENKKLSKELILERELKSQVISDLVKHRNEERRYLIATRARLVGLERVYGSLVSEIFDAGEMNKFLSLRNTYRRSTLLLAWNQIVASDSIFKPSIIFSYERLPYETE